MQAYDPLLPEEYTSEQSRVNITAAGSQKFPALAMTPSGGYVTVWTGNGVGDQSGIFARRYNEPTDTAGPLMTRISGTDGKSVLNVLQDPTYTLDDISSQLIAGTDGVKYLVVTFDEAMLEGNPLNVPDSVTNPANYRLTRKGAAIPLAIDHIEYAKNPLTNKYEAKIFLKQPVTTNGTYTLTVFSPKPPSAANPSGSSGLRDKAGNPLGRTGFATEGADFSGTFRVLAGLPSTVTTPGTPDSGDKSIADIQVNTITTGVETIPKVASNANGDFVVVWVSKDLDTLGDIMAQRYDRIGRTLGAQFQVSSYQDTIPTTVSAQTMPDVAMDAYGNFVVVWAGEGDGDSGGVFGRVFDTSGVATGDDFRINQYVPNSQDRPTVAMDFGGNFVVTWTSSGQDSDQNGVFARRFNASGIPLGNEFQVNTTSNYSQQSTDIGMDSNGDFTVVWQSDQQDGTSWGIYGQRYNAAGQRQGGEFQVNGYTTDKQNDPQIAMDADGDFIVVWTSFGQDGNGYGVYARRYNAAGAALESSEFRVNKTTTNWQYQPAVSADKNGNFVVLWTSFGYDDPFNKSYGIYGHMYSPSGGTYSDPTTGEVMDEFRVNVTTPGPQVEPAVAMDADGDFISAWVGPSQGAPTGSTTEIYARISAVNRSTYLPILPKSATGTMSPPTDYTSPVNGMLSLSGTTGNDTFEFFAGSSPSAWGLKVNNKPQVITSDIVGISLDGLSGMDTLWFYGANGALIADIGYEQGTFQFGGYTLSFANMDYVTVSGASGNDTATLHNSAAADAFQGLSGQAQLTAPGKAITVKNFKSVTVQGGIHDTAVMFDSPNGGSNYTAGPSGVNFVGAGFNYTTTGFTAVSAYAAPGKNNTAVFNSTDGSDLLIASYLGAQYIGAGFAYDVWNLTNIQGNGGTGDEARFYGSPGGNTVLNLSPTLATQNETNLKLTGNNYSTFASYVYPNGNTSATITGTAGAEHAVTSTLGAQLTGTNFAISAWTYSHINIVGNGGADTADMYAAAGANSFIGNGPTATLTSGSVDRTATNFNQVTAHGNAASSATFFAKSGMTNTFNAGPTQAAMSGTGYKNVAAGFGSNTGYAIPGGTDVVNYTDSAGADFFISSYLGSQMFGPGFSNAGWNFATMNATSTAGADTARFYGSPKSADSFIAAPGDAKHSGAGYASEAKNFFRVEAYSGPGTGGTAQLTGSTGNDRFVGSTLGTTLSNANYDIEAWNFASVKAEGNGGNDIADLYGGAANNTLAADNVFAEFSGNGFSNRVSNFATTRVHGSTTGTDTAALDHAYLETGAEDQPLNNQGLTINRKLWLYDFDQVTTTEKPVKITPQSVAVDKLMTAFMFE